MKGFILLSRGVNKYNILSKKYRGGNSLLVTLMQLIQSIYYANEKKREQDGKL